MEEKAPEKNDIIEDNLKKKRKWQTPHIRELTEIEEATKNSGIGVVPDGALEANGST